MLFFLQNTTYGKARNIAEEVSLYVSLTVLWHINICVNPLMATLKPQGNGTSYSNTVIGTSAVDGCYIWYSEEGSRRAVERFAISEMTLNDSFDKTNSLN